METPTSPARTIIDTLVTYRKWWLAPTLVCTLLAIGLAIFGSKSYTSRQSLVVRDDLVGSHFKPGRFESLDSMKSAQETILEVSRRPQVVRNALAKLGPPALTTEAAWLGDQNLETMQGKIQISAPNGAEFGRTEVIVLSVQQNSRERAGKFVSYLLDEIENTLRDLRSDQFASMQVELTQANAIAEKSYLEAASELKSFERKIGVDLSTLISLNDAQAGTNNLQNELSRLSVEQRTAWSDVENVNKQIQILKDIADQPESLLEVPQELLQLQPTLSSLAKGLNDAVLAFSKSRGRYQPQHPKVREDRRSVEDIKQQIADKLTRTLGSLKNQLDLREAKYDRITQLINQKKQRLGELSSLRVDYTTLRQEVDKMREINAKAQTSLAQIATLGTSARKVSLISRIDQPQTELYPDGPSNKLVVFGGMLAGLLIGIGLVMFVAPYDVDGATSFFNLTPTADPNPVNESQPGQERDSDHSDAAIQPAVASKNSIRTISDAIKRQSESPAYDSNSTVAQQESTKIGQHTNPTDGAPNPPKQIEDLANLILQKNQEDGNLPLTANDTALDSDSPLSQVSEPPITGTVAEDNHLELPSIASTTEFGIDDSSNNMAESISQAIESLEDESSFDKLADASDNTPADVKDVESEPTAAEIEAAEASVDAKLDDFFSTDEPAPQPGDFTPPNANAEIEVPKVQIDHIIDNTGTDFIFEDHDPLESHTEPDEIAESDDAKYFELPESEYQNQGFNKLYEDGNAQILESSNSEDNDVVDLSGLRRGKIDHRNVAEKLDQLQDTDSNNADTNINSLSSIQQSLADYSTSNSPVTGAIDHLTDQPSNTSTENPSLSVEGHDLASNSEDKPEGRPTATTVDLRMLKEQLAGKNPSVSPTAESKPLSELFGEHTKIEPETEIEQPVDENISALADSIQDICRQSDHDQNPEGS